ncbi:MAG: acriflavin resistance protein [Candidatus Scalindua rubra]|uniref:Acriflavin resistance protein n=1 Tax=Candidatus Scalindua rubra TaxID=1872076 RepID=A0A1E3XDF2_9BACT|nr:MAG: acriflavin resistance protein [Candidatus Scalindua rubra]
MGNFAVNKPVAVSMLILLLVLLGALAWKMLPRDLFPDISKPVLGVVTKYEGASSQEIEETITRKLEEKLGTAKGVKAMQSFSGNEKSEIVLEFGWGTKMDIAVMDVREKLDQVKDDLPDDADSPLISRDVGASQAVVVLNVSARHKALESELREKVDSSVKLRLERIDGVAAVLLSGGDQYEVKVYIDQNRLKEFGITNEDVRVALERENISQRGGRLAEGRTDYLVRTVGKYTSIDDISKTVVSNRGEKPIYLRDVAYSIRRMPKKKTDIARMKSPDVDKSSLCIELAVFKKPGGNTVKISEAIGKGVEVLKVEYPELDIVISYDQAIYINNSLKMVMSNGKQGLILAIIILLVFLRSAQSTIVVALSMPVSVIAAFILFKAKGMGVNIFSLAGLTLAVGMTVDNAIVVIEAIFVNLSYDKRVRKAIIAALKEVGAPVFSSTLTTLAVFLPIVFVPGLGGQIFKDLSYTIIFTLIFSLLVAFTLIPMLASKLLGSTFIGFRLVNSGLTLLLDKIFFIGWFGGKVLYIYDKIIKFVIDKWYTRLALIFSVGFIFFLSLKLMPGSELFPPTSQKEYEILVETPTGFTLEKTDSIVNKIEGILNSEERIRRYSVTFLPGNARIIVVFDSGENADVAAMKIRNKISNSVPDISLKISSISPLQAITGGGEGDIQIKVSGEGLGELRNISNKAMAKLSDVDWIVNLSSSVGEGYPEIHVTADRLKASDVGLTMKEIADTLEIAIGGQKATDVEMSEGTHEIRLSARSEDLASIRDINAIPVKTAYGTFVRVGEVCNVESKKGPVTIIREERQRVAVINVDVDKQSSLGLGDMINVLKNGEESGVLDDIELPVGYDLRLGGSTQAMQESFKYLIYALAFAILLVYMVMAAQFESLLHPLTILFSVPLSLIGAIIGLKIYDFNLSLTAFIGIIMLAGIVVNNAIILIDFVNLLRARGRDRNDAIIEAGKLRLRPIFMTTLTTVLGMFPMALGIGEGGELYQPLAVVVIGGLSVSTLLTLVFIPIMYCFFDDIQDLFGFIRFKISTMFSR